MTRMRSSRSFRRTTIGLRTRPVVQALAVELVHILARLVTLQILPGRTVADHYVNPPRRDDPPEVYDGARKRRSSDLDPRGEAHVHRRQATVMEADMKNIVSRVVSERAPRDSCGDRERCTVGLMYQYLLSGWLDAFSFSLVQQAEGSFRSVGRSASVRSRENAYRAHWLHAGCRGAKFPADQNVHDAPFVGSVKD